MRSAPILSLCVFIRKKTAVGRLTNLIFFLMFTKTTGEFYKLCLTTNVWKHSPFTILKDNLNKI